MNHVAALAKGFQVARPVAHRIVMVLCWRRVTGLSQRDDKDRHVRPGWQGPAATVGPLTALSIPPPAVAKMLHVLAVRAAARLKRIAAESCGQSIG